MWELDVSIDNLKGEYRQYSLCDNLSIGTAKLNFLSNLIELPSDICKYMCNQVLQTHW